MANTVFKKKGLSAETQRFTHVILSCFFDFILKNPDRLDAETHVVDQVKQWLVSFFALRGDRFRDFLGGFY